MALQEFQTKPICTRGIRVVRVDLDTAELLHRFPYPTRDATWIDKRSVSEHPVVEILARRSHCPASYQHTKTCDRAGTPCYRWHRVIPGDQAHHRDARSVQPLRLAKLIATITTIYRRRKSDSRPHQPLGDKHPNDKRQYEESRALPRHKFQAIRTH